MSKKKIKRPQQYRRDDHIPTMTEWWQGKTPQARKTILGVCIAVVAVIALIFIWYYGIYDDGSLKVRDGALVNVQDNWLVGERSKGKNSPYYHLADVETPAGLEVMEDSLAGTGTSLRQDFSYSGTAESGEFTVYIAGVNNSLADMIDGIYPQFGAMVGENGSISEKGTYESALGTSQYFSYTMAYDGDDGVKNYSQSLVMYAPCAYKDSCVLVNVSSKPESEEDYWTEDALLEQAVNALSSVTLPAKQ